MTEKDSSPSFAATPLLAAEVTTDVAPGIPAAHHQVLAGAVGNQTRPPLSGIHRPTLDDQAAMEGELIAHSLAEVRLPKGILLSQTVIGKDGQILLLGIQRGQRILWQNGEVEKISRLELRRVLDQSDLAPCLRTERQSQNETEQSIFDAWRRSQITVFGTTPTCLARPEVYQLLFAESEDDHRDMDCLVALRDWCLEAANDQAEPRKERRP